MREIKFRVWYDGEYIHWRAGDKSNWFWEMVRDYELTPEQYIGLHDKNGEEYYKGSIGEFDNGDGFVIDTEWWLEFFVSWIGEPECEDQARDLYRIEAAKIIGNHHQNPELLEDK